MLVIFMTKTKYQHIIIVISSFLFCILHVCSLHWYFRVKDVWEKDFSDIPRHFPGHETPWSLGSCLNHNLRNSSEQLKGWDCSWLPAVPGLCRTLHPAVLHLCKQNESISPFWDLFKAMSSSCTCYLHFQAHLKFHLIVLFCTPWLRHKKCPSRPSIWDTKSQTEPCPWNLFTGWPGEGHWEPQVETSSLGPALLLGSFALPRHGPVAHLVHL